MAAAFAWSAASKFGHRASFAEGLADFGVPRAGFVARFLPVLEAGLAVLLVIVRDSAAPALLAVAVLAVFTAVVVANLLRGVRRPCPCFGPPGPDARPVSAATVARNGYLVALAVIGTGSADGASTLTALGAALPVVVVTLVALRR